MPWQGANRAIPLSSSSRSFLSPQIGRTDFWQPYLLYRQASPCPRLYVEIDAVAGCEPSDTALKQLKELPVASDRTRRFLAALFIISPGLALSAALCRDRCRGRVRTERYRSQEAQGVSGRL